MLDVATYNLILFPDLVNLCSVPSTFYYDRRGGGQTASLSADNVSILGDLGSIQYGHSIDIAPYRFSPPTPLLDKAARDY